MADVSFWGPVDVTISTGRAFELIDVTDRLARVVGDHPLAAGSVQVFCPHTSCGLAITELEDGLHQDIEAVMDELASTTRGYVHDNLVARTQNLEPRERENGWSHVRALLMTQPSIALPVRDATITLGQWQRVFLVELDGPRPARKIHMQGWGLTGG
jgi:secondary thiamine-phosphate synthase enzyme